MRRSRIALAALLLLAVACVSASAGSPWRPVQDGDQVRHTEGSRCPDPDDRGHPCGPGCACSCCPGHASWALSVPEPFFLGAPLPGRPSLGLYDDLHPEELPFRIFHPPRA